MEKLKHYIQSIRWFEIAVRMGGPVLGILFAARELYFTHGIEILHALVAFFFLWAHGYTFNEWGGYSFDQYKLAKPKTPLLAGKISRQEMLMLSGILALVSILLYILLDPRFLIIVFIDIIIGVMYVHPQILLKNVPFVSLLILFIVSVNDFLLGWLLYSSSLSRGLFIGIYFGILGITGQHYHEAGDYDVDKQAGIKTNAVRFGKKRMFLLGFIFYTISIIYFCVLSFLKIIPASLYLVLLITYPIYVYMLYTCIGSGMYAIDIHQFVKRYRLLYGFIGLWMIVQLLYFEI